MEPVLSKKVGNVWYYSSQILNLLINFYGNASILVMDLDLERLACALAIKHRLKSCFR